MAQIDFITTDPKGSLVILLGLHTQTTPHANDYEMKTAIKEVFDKFLAETETKIDVVCIDELFTRIRSQAEMAINRAKMCDSKTLREFVNRQLTTAIGSIPWTADTLQMSYFDKYIGEMIVRLYFVKIKSIVDEKACPRKLTRQIIIANLESLADISREMLSTLVEDKACA
jgi:hypothetical protein